MKPTELTRDNMRMRTDDAPPGEPAGHRVMVHIEKPPEKTKSGLIIPTMAQDAIERTCEEGTVVSVGRNAWMGYGDNSPWCQAGDVVHFIRHAGKEVAIDGELYRVLNDEDVYYVCGNGSGGE